MLRLIKKITFLYYSATCIRSFFYALAVCLISCPIILAQSNSIHTQGLLSGDTISYVEKKAISEQTTLLTQEALRSFLKDKGRNADQHVEVISSITFDENSLKKDSEQFRQQQAKDFEAYRGKAYEEYMNRLLEVKKQFTQSEINADGKDSKTDTTAFVPPDKKTRFGSLNLDIDGNVTNQILSKESAAKDALSTNEENTSKKGVKPETPLLFSIAMPSMDRPEILAFQFNPLSYISGIEQSIYLEDTLNDEERGQLEKIFKSKINFFINREISQQKFTFSTFKPYQKSWVERFFAPESGTVSQFLSSLLLSICMLFGLLIISKAFKLIAKNMLELKPIEEKDANATIDALWQESQDLAEEKDSDKDGPVYDAAATANALTSEMKTIRTQLEEIILQMPQNAAEILHDMFYDRSHLFRFRELINFTGYQPIKPAMDLLPKKLIDVLKEFLEEVRDEPVNLLTGVEVTQLLYQDITARTYGEKSHNDTFNALRESLLKIDDATIGSAAKHLSASEIALILGIFTAERADRLADLLPAPVLKEALIKMDETEDNEDVILVSVLEKIELFAKENALKKSDVAVRFIMRLVYNATIDDEEKIWQLIDPNDWETKLKIMKTHFFFRDLKYVDLKYIKLILDVLAPRHKANLLLLFPKDIKDAYMASLQDGSKIKDMLNAEIEQITSNDGEMTDILKKRQKIIRGFLDNLRQMISKNDVIIKEVILKQCEEHNLELPDFVKTETPEAAQDSENSQDAA